MIGTANIATAIALIAASIPLASAQPGGTKRVEIVDRVFNRTAYTYAVPATWSFQGAVIPGTRCDASPSPVFRTSSQDGMTGEYFLPRVDWFFPNTTSPECALWRQMISAREFLTFMVGVLRVGFVREEDISGDIAEYRRNIDKMNAQFGPTMTVRGDMAKFLVRYELNGRAVDEWVSALVQCSESVVAGMRSHFFRCGAYTTRQRAPQGQLPTAAAMFRSIGKSAVIDPQWNQQWNAMVIQRINDMYAEQTRRLFEIGRLAQAERTRQHQEFMASTQRGRDLNQYRFKERMYAKQHANDDRVDYILDCQRDENGRPMNRSCPDRQTAP